MIKVFKIHLIIFWGILAIASDAFTSEVSKQYIQSENPKTKTEKNLMGAFAGESQARNRYTFFAGAAKKEGLVQIADIFTKPLDESQFKYLRAMADRSTLTTWARSTVESRHR